MYNSTLKVVPSQKLGAVTWRIQTRNESESFVSFQFVDQILQPTLIIIIIALYRIQYNKYHGQSTSHEGKIACACALIQTGKCLLSPEQRKRHNGTRETWIVIMMPPRRFHENAVSAGVILLYPTIHLVRIEESRP